MYSSFHKYSPHILLLQPEIEMDIIGIFIGMDTK